MDKSITREKVLKELKENLGVAFYYECLDTIKKIMLETIEDKISMKNNFMMTGIGVNLNDIFSKIKDCKEKEKLENEFQNIWKKWYFKNQSYAKENFNLNNKEEGNN